MYIMYILAFHILWDNILGRYFGMKIDFQIFHSKFLGPYMFSTADLEIKNVPNPLRRYHLSAVCPEDI